MRSKHHYLVMSIRPDHYTYIYIHGFAEPPTSPINIFLLLLHLAIIIIRYILSKLSLARTFYLQLCRLPLPVGNSLVTRDFFFAVTQGLPCLAV